MSEHLDRRDVLKLTGTGAVGASLAVQSVTAGGESGGAGPDETPPPIVGDDPPQDIDGDGLYEDIDGDGEFDISDVEVFFENFDTELLQDNAQFFRFSAPEEEDPDELTIFDVQALFDRLADDSTPPIQTHADRAQVAWEEAAANPLPGDEDVRNGAYIEMEEAARDDAILVPLYHRLTERFWYDHVDVPKLGAVGRHAQQHNETQVEGDDTLNLISDTVETLDPVHSTGDASAEVITQMYETLTHYPNGVPELEFELLDSYEVSSDATTWTFTLREDIQFHDGTELTAHDLKYSWERLALSNNSTRPQFILDADGFLGLEHETDPDDGEGPMNAVPESLGLDVLDDQTLEIHLAEPNPDVLDIVSYVGFAVMPEGYVDDVPGYDGEHTWQEVHQEVANGTGPFELDFFDIDQAVQVVRNDEYHGEVADVEAVHWEMIESPDARWTYIQNENADVFTVPIEFYDPDAVDAEVDERGRDVGTYGPDGQFEEPLNYLGVTGLSTLYLGFNASHTHRAVRQAVAYVLDKPQVIQESAGLRAKPAYSLLPPGVWPTGWEGYQEFLDDYQYSAGESDVSSAETVLEEAGFTPGDPADTKLTIYGSEPFETAGEHIQTQLDGTGADIDVEQTTFGVLLGRGRDGDLEMYSLGWIWSWAAPTHGSANIEPRNTNTDEIPDDASGFFLDWQANLSEAFQD